MSTARQRFEALLAGRSEGRPAWLPLVDELPARVLQSGYRELSTDPGLWSAGLMTAAELLEADAILAGFDPTLVAEACGAELDWSVAPPRVAASPREVGLQPLGAPRLAALLETLRRLSATVRARLGLVAVLTGPGTLARQLCPGQPLEEALRSIKGTLMAVAEAALKARPDLLLFVEDLPDPAAEPERAWQRAFGTLRNLAAHYDVPLALRAEGWGPAQAGWLAGLKMDVYFLGHGSGDPLDLARQLAAARVSVGVPIPATAGEEARALVAAVRAERAQGCRLFLTTAGAVGSGGDLAGLRGFATELAAAA